MLEQEKKLVEEAQKDPEKFSVLYDRYFVAIYRYVARRVDDRDAAEDLVSQTFHDAFSHLKSYEWRGFSFSAWLYKIAHNNVLKWYRSSSRAQTADLDVATDIADPGMDTMRDAARQELKSEVQEAMAKLEPEDREIIRLKFFEELSNVEIAEVMGLSANHIGVKVFRALQKVKQLLSS